jgi:hypothetical protein
LKETGSPHYLHRGRERLCDDHITTPQFPKLHPKLWIPNPLAAKNSTRVFDFSHGEEHTAFG